MARVRENPPRPSDTTPELTGIAERRSPIRRVPEVFQFPYWPGRRPALRDGVKVRFFQRGTCY